MSVERSRRVQEITMWREAMKKLHCGERERERESYKLVKLSHFPCEGE